MPLKLKGLPVTVIGAGESGIASAKLLRRSGALVRVSSVGAFPPDFARWCAANRVPTETGEHRESFLEGSRLLVVSPGVKPSSPVIRYALRRRIPVWSEIELAWRACRGRVAAVTGTNGKTTTSTLLWEMIRHHRPCHLCGNIGNSLAASVLEKGPAVWRVVEVSSFQMKYVDRFRPDAAAVLNLSPNHLDWHPSLSDYYGSKLRIAAAQTSRQALVVNGDDAALVRRSAKLKSKKILFSLRPLKNGLTVQSGRIVRVTAGKARVIADLAKFKLKGDHNLQNALAASACALALGVPAKAIQAALDSAKPLPHRVEEIAKVGEVRFVNDSKSTTAMSTAAAIRGFAPDPGVVLIAGGRRKQKSFREVFPEVKKRVRAIVFYGEAAEELSREFSFFKNRTVVRDFGGAVRKARSLASAGQTVLLSPMCSSFDQFASYRDRGDAFRRIVGEIARGA